MVNNSQMWMVILIAFLLLFCLDVKVSQMEKRNAQLNTQCDISVFTETEGGTQKENIWGGCNNVVGIMCPPPGLARMSKGRQTNIMSYESQYRQLKFETLMRSPRLKFRPLEVTE